MDDFLEAEITIAINNDRVSPWLLFKRNGKDLIDWKMMRITEHGNLWIPYEMRK